MLGAAMANPYPNLASAPPEDPPSYADAQHGAGAPPSYNELFGEFRQVDSPSGLAKFVYRAINFIADTVAAAVVLALLNIIPILMIILGSLNRENCPVREMIPVWLIVAGSCALLRSAINFAYRFRDQQNRVRPLIVRLFESFLSIFMVIWFVLGSIWVYSVYSSVNYDHRDRNSCDHATYMFSFVFITVTYCLAFLSCFCFCCCCCCICFRRPNPHVQIENP